MPIIGPTPDRLPFDHVKVELALATYPDDPAPAWTDVSAWVDMDAGIRVTTGRVDEFATVQTGTIGLTLDNTDGRFTAGNPSSPYYPNVKVRKRLRISYQNPVGPGPVSYRGTGYLDEVPTEWPGGGDTYSVAQIAASDRFKRLGSSNPLRSIITQEYLLDSPVAYFTLGEPDTSTTAGDTSRNGLAALTTAQVGAGGTLAFAVNTGPPTDALSAPAFTPVNVTNGKYLAGFSPASTGAGGSIECFALTSSVVQQTLVRIADTSGNWAAISTTAAGKASATNWNALTGAADFTLTSPLSVNNGATHQVAVTQSFTGGTATVNLIVDGVSVASTTYAGVSLPGYSVINIGGTPTGACFTGTISHVAVYASTLTVARLLSHRLAATTGFAGERSDQRIARLAGYVGIPAGEQSLEVGLSTSIAFVDPTGVAALQAMQDVAATENGTLFMDGAGVLTFQARSHRYNTASALSLNSSDIDPGLKFIANDALLVNDVTASHAGGITFRAVNAQSILDYGPASITLTLLTTSDNETMDAANWRANQSATITPRLPALTVDLLTSNSLHAGAMLLTIGSRVTLTGLPFQAPGASLDLFVEGWTETISTTGWVIAWNMSPADQSTVWRLGIAGFSELGVTTKLSY